MRFIGFRHQLKIRMQNFARRFYTKAIILMYHRVTELPADPYEITVSPDHFRGQMDYIRQQFHPMRLLDFLDAADQHSVPPRAVVVTFDDGYVDNYQNALPILEDAEVPATVFITTGNLGSEKEFWWDTLERVFLQPRQLPDALQLDLHGSRQVWPVKTTEQRLHAHQSVYRGLRSLHEVEREQLLCELLHWAAVDPNHRPGYRSMNQLELSHLAQSEMVEIGAHTVSHPALSLLAVEDQHNEIMSSRRTLERLIGQPVTTFSYPFGKFSGDTIEVMQAAGFRAACTTVPKAVTHGDDRLQMGRYTVKNWPKQLFAEKMEAFFHESD